MPETDTGRQFGDAGVRTPEEQLAADDIEPDVALNLKRGLTEQLTKMFL